MSSKKEHAASIVAAGRSYLNHWLSAAEAHGTIYYEVTHVARSGMSRRIVLSTIIDRNDGDGPTLQRLWPTLLDADGAADRGTSENLDIVAKDWSFSFKHRAFIVGGCGMDMVFALVDNLAHLAGIKAIPNRDKRMDKFRSGESYANRVRRESFSNT